MDTAATRSLQRCIPFEIPFPFSLCAVLSGHGWGYALGLLLSRLP